jgi:hypothetical protein
MENIVYDIISWIGLTICISAFFVKDIFWLRLTTLVGCSLLFVYYSYIAIPQGVISNLLVLLINAYYLLRCFGRRSSTVSSTPPAVNSQVAPTE